MTLINTRTVITLVACHGASADHFAIYAERLLKDNYRASIFTSEHGVKKFQDRGITINQEFSLGNLTGAQEESLARQIATTCSMSSILITDVGHLFAEKVHKALQDQTPEMDRYAYYDNPESYVPGGYSQVASKVMLAAKGTIFANENLANEPIFSSPTIEIDFGTRKRVGLGYYPLEQAEKIAKRRNEEHESLRSQFLEDNRIDQQIRQVIAYFGGNNEVYFEQALPAFLSLLSQSMQEIDLSHFVCILQQHPVAKLENIDGLQVVEWLKENQGNPYAPKIIISNFGSDLAQIICNHAFYYQTSMGPQLAWNIPTTQIGHDTYEDILVKNNLAKSITSKEELTRLIKEMKPETNQEKSHEIIRNKLGIRQDWFKILKSILTS